MTSTEFTPSEPRIEPAIAEMSVTTADEVRWVRLEGRLDSAGVGQIKEHFEAATVASERHAIIDISGVVHIASTGARLLVSVAKKMALRGRVLVLLKPQPKVDAYFKAADLYRLVPVAYSENEAAVFLAD